MTDQVDEIKQKSDIVTIISEYITLKKAGKNFKALCPFHSEKSPSFIVSPELQHFKCFGCSESGDVITFLEKYEGMDFYEALKFLADRAGITLKNVNFSEYGLKDNIYKINRTVGSFYQYILLKHPAGKEALDYLFNRGLKLDTIKTFKLGYSPDEPFAARRFLVDKKKISIKDLESAGLVYSKDGRSYDRFRGRVVFPLFDHRGNTIGFAGRILHQKKNFELAKYINTPETDVYHKSKVLYGLEITKREIKKAGSAVIVEGELDMISTWQTGIKNVVAIKGSALTQEQVKLLSRYANELILALDADVAGDSASRRGIEIAEKEGFDIRVVKLVGYKDPDEAARGDPEYLKKAITEAIGVWDFIIDSVFSKKKGNQGLDKAKISREIVPILANITDTILQSHYIQIVARRLGVSVDAVTEEVQNRKQKTEKAVPKLLVVTKDEKKDRRELMEERLMSVCFRHDLKILLNEKIYPLIKTPLTKNILDEFLDFNKKNKEFDPSVFAGKLSGELVSGFTDMILKDIKGISDSPEVYKKEIEILLNELATLTIKEDLENLGAKIKEFEDSEQKDRLKKAEEQFGKLTKKLSELEDSGFRGIILN